MPTPSKITTLAQLIAQAESANNQFATRFEPAYRPNPAHVSVLAKNIDCTYMTAETLCAMSWGLYQIMGDNLVGMGLTISPLQFCSSPDMQGLYFARYVQTANCNYSLEQILGDTPTRLDFARKYNGPGQPENYAAYLLQIYKNAEQA